MKSRKKATRGLSFRFPPAALMLAGGLTAAFLFAVLLGPAGCQFDSGAPEPAEDVGAAPADMDMEAEAEAEAGSRLREEVTDPFADKDQTLPRPERDRPAQGPEAGPEQAPAVPGSDWESLPVIADGNYLLALVTKETTLKKSYVPFDLKPVPSYMNPSYPMRIRVEALKHLERLWEAAQEEGIVLSIRSAYRSYGAQEQLFKEYARRHGVEEANRFSARPGQSEHQLGTTVDFGGTEADFTARFAGTDQGRWLAENAHYYGFALSYPKGGEQVTGYIYEPWHFRYIGVDAAMEWKESGLVLQEYLEKQPQVFEE